MILDIFLIIIFLVAVISGRKTGLFRTVARLTSLLFASVCTAVWGEPFRAWVRCLPVYHTVVESLSGAVEESIAKGDTMLFIPFLQQADSSAMLAAEGIVEMFLTALSFVLFSIIIRLLIQFVDRLFFRLPLIRPINRFLGMAFSFVFTGIVAYLVIGLFGSVALCSDSVFFKEQMETSVLVRGMYENNIILNLFISKG